ncbi:unnamed protein product [marine sediment metagenome]|uniref:Uncharacterized protein n=1 Tax=marine sediment metagenome TaxID=412755 RepID=X1LMV1_9ZZZZ
MSKITPMIEPSDLDKRAAKGFQALANESSFFPVTCRFRRIVKPDTDHVFWSKGAEEFKVHFGNAANYFAGALEYIHLATGWSYPYHDLEVVVLGSKRRTSNGCAFYPPGLRGDPKSGEVRIFWANDEFTWTVLHELIHLFKKGMDEDWVEQQALKLTLGV